MRRTAQGPRPQDTVLGAGSPPSWLFDISPSIGRQAAPPASSQQLQQQGSVHGLPASDEDEPATRQHSRRSTCSGSQEAAGSASAGNRRPVSLGHTPRSSSQQRLTSLVNLDDDWMFGISNVTAGLQDSAADGAEMHSHVQSELVAAQACGPAWQVAQGNEAGREHLQSAGSRQDEHAVPYRLQPRHMPQP